MGQGLPYPAPQMVPWGNLFLLPSWTGDETDPLVAQDWYMSGLSAPAPIEIPYSWLSGPLRFRQDKAFTRSSVTKSGAGIAVSVVDSDEEIEHTATLDSNNNVDTGNLAHFTVTYYDEPRTRASQLRLFLNKRAPTEIWTILGVKVGDRITITGTPTGWPNGATSLVVEGIHHTSAGARVVEWSTSPLIGETIGSVGPFFRVGVSALDGTDLLPW